MVCRQFLMVFLAVCSTVALFADVESTGNLSMALNGAGIVQCVALAAIILLYRNFANGEKWAWEKIPSREKKIYGMVSLLFAAFMIIGKAQTAHADLKYPVIAAVMFIGYVPFLFCLIWLVGHTTCRAAMRKPEAEHGKVASWLFEQHPPVGSMLCVYIGRLPYWIAFYPCSMSWDGGVQIGSFFGTESFTDHHPPLLSFFYGGIAWYSNQWGHANAGMFLITFLQTTLTAYAVSRVFVLFKKMRTPYWLRGVALAYYALFSVWCIFDCTVIKDSLYHSLTLLFTIKVIECLNDSDAFFSNKINWIAFVLYAVLVAEVRNNGIFVLAFVCPVLFVASRGAKRWLMGMLSGVGIGLVLLLNQVVWPAAGVVQLESKVDTYCVMFQQTAKYAQEHPDDVTDEEREILDTLFDYDEMAKVYNPRLADWVKNCLRIQEGSEEDPTGSFFAQMKGDYFKVWFSQFKRHPLTYLEAFLECSYGYYYPEVRPYKEGAGFYEYEAYTFTASISSAHQLEGLADARFALEQISKLEYAPGIGLLYHPGFYTWVLMLACAVLLVRGYYRMVLAAIPAWVNVLVCLVSPVNTCIRYCLPVMCFIPLLLAFCLYSDYEKEKIIDR